MTNKDKNAFSPKILNSKHIWTVKTIAKLLYEEPTNANLKATERAIQASSINFSTLNEFTITDEHSRPAKRLVLEQLIEFSRKKRKLILFVQDLKIEDGQRFLALNDARGGRRWIRLNPDFKIINSLESALITLSECVKRNIVLMPSGSIVIPFRKLVKQYRNHCLVNKNKDTVTVALEVYSHGKGEILEKTSSKDRQSLPTEMTHLDRLEAESIHIIREVIAEAKNPVMLYSIGKDSSVMLHLARKAFFPSRPPFPLLHIDTCWKFQSMYDFRDYMASKSEMELLVHINPEGVAKNINPFEHGSENHTYIMKTQSLKMALDHYKFDVAFGGARRDEEKSRAKERIFSFRTATHSWNPKNQRPELWNLYNSKKKPNESIRVFPISNWTELDIWNYIYREQIPIVPLYFAAERPVVERNGMLMMVDDDRLPLRPKEIIQLKKIRFRTLGCYPLTMAIESEADDIASIVLELLNTRNSERQGRSIDKDSDTSMEKKKQEGYF